MASDVEWLIDWYRQQLTTNKFRRDRLTVLPPRLAAWVVAGPGEPHERDGLRPLGAIRDRLEGLIARADLPARERAVLRARAGLTEYPKGGKLRPLGRRLPPPPKRRGRQLPSDGDRVGVGDGWVSQIYGGAVRELAPRDLSDPHGDLTIEPRAAPEPADAPWFVERVLDPVERRRLLEHAIEAARIFVCVGGHDAAVEEVVRELDAYQSALERATGGRSPSRKHTKSRARALVGVALWGLVQRPSHDLGMSAALQSACRVVPAGVGAASEPVSRLLRGDVDDDIVLAACDDVLRCNWTDHPRARALADPLLSAYAPPDARTLGHDAGATLLRTVIRVRALDQDISVLGLARRAIHDHPRAWMTIDGVQAAVRVASAHRLVRSANWLLDWAAAALRDDFDLLPGRLRTVEQAEFKLWNDHERTAAVRCRADLLVPSRDDLQRTLTLTDTVWREFHEVMRRKEQGLPGDARRSWEYFLHIRRAELWLVVAAQQEDAERGPALRRAHHYTRLAQNAFLETELRGDRFAEVGLLKTKLRFTLLSDVDGRDTIACGLAQRIGHAGWPLSRTPVTAPLLSPVLGRFPRLRELVRSLLDQQRSGLPTLVDGGSRLRWSLAAA